MPLLVEESAPRRVVVPRRGGPHPREEPVHAPRPVALEAEDAARIGDAVLLRGPRRRRRAANLDVAVDGRQVVVRGNEGHPRPRCFNIHEVKPHPSLWETMTGLWRGKGKKSLINAAIYLETHE